MILPIPQSRTAPPEILAGLREVDATTEMIYLNDGHWVVMRLRPLNDVRIKSARQGMQTTVEQTLKAGGIVERTWYARLRSYRMAMLGYTHVTAWDFDGDPDHRVVQDYRMRAWKLRHDVPYDDHLIEDDKRRQAAKDALLDPYAAAEISRSLRNPVSLTVNTAMPKGA